MDIREIMQERYPSADFGEYFRFIVSCAGTPQGLTHEHHIAPRKQFPELVRASENLITLTISDRATAHKLLGAAHLDFRHNIDAWIAAASSLTFASERMKRLNADPVFAAANVERMKKQNTNLTFTAARDASNRKRMKDLQADPVFAAENALRASAIFKRLNADPVFAAARDVRCKAVAHKRYHVNRGLFSTECELCCG